MNLRKRTWEILEVAEPGDRVSRYFDIFILTLIFLNVVAVIMGTVAIVQASLGGFLHWFEIASVAVFTVEYIARLWSCVTNPAHQKAVSGRFWFMTRPMSVIDLLAVLPFYLPFLGIDLRALRVFRLLRIFRVLKVGRYYRDLRIITNVLREKKEELVLSVAILFFLVVISSSFMFYAEHSAQPEAFPNIPAAMWWSVVTLSSVGYGDVYPITTVGKLLASTIAILGIGMFALPTGILGAGFVEELQKRKAALKSCPHCGKDIQ